MQREIKFRGRRADNGEWVYGGSIIKFDDNGIIKYFMVGKAERCIATHDNETDNIIAIEGKFYKVENICQYTGLKDKNGKEIYEGDIVKETNANYVWIIEWDDLDFGWSARSIKTGIAYSLCESEFEVLGNIYKNPELLQEVTKNGNRD